MPEDLTKRSGVFKNVPVDISNTFVQITNENGEKIIIGQNYGDHFSDISDISHNVLFYLESDAEFHKNVRFDGSENAIDISGTLTANKIKLGDSVVDENNDDYVNALLYVDESGNILSTNIDFNKLEYATALSFENNSIAVLETDEFAVKSTNTTYENAFMVHKESTVDLVGIKTNDPKVSRYSSH